MDERDQKMKRFLFLLSFFAVPSPVWGFVPHEYPAIYTHQVGAVFYCAALSIVLWVIVHNRLQREKGWRCFFFSVILFIIWDLDVLSARFAEAWWIEASQTVGDTAGWRYFARKIAIEGPEYIYYLGRFDFILLDAAMLFFYRGLREHLDRQTAASSPALALLPLLPVIATEMGGSVVFIVLSLMSLWLSVRLYRTDRDNPLWHYMVWLSSSYLMFSVSRSFGHFLRPILVSTGNEHIWSYLDGITGSVNTSVRFVVASLTLFFIWTYKIYLKMLRDREEIELVNRDVTELNQELETLVAERTMAIMGLTVADRVRNPAMLIGCACKRIIEKETTLSGEFHDVIDECKKLESIVGDFESLLKSRKSVFKYEDINAIASGAVSVLEKEASQKGIRTVLYLSAEPLRINAQKNLLRVAIYHVLRNAIDATPSGGRITLTTYADNDKVALVITDSGSGIPKENIEKIFDPFYSTKQLRFGMGLPMVKQIVSEHLGEITVESEPEEGTVFKVVFPARWIEKKARTTTSEEQKPK